MGATQVPGPRRRLGKGAAGARVLRETEAGFQAWVTAYAELHGWAWVHFRPARTEAGWRTAIEGDGVGWPDLTLVRPPRLIYVELKGTGGNLSAAQDRWLERLDACTGVEAFAWWPDDRPAIERILK